LAVRAARYLLISLEIESGDKRCMAERACFACRACGGNSLIVGNWHGYLAKKWAVRPWQSLVRIATTVSRHAAPVACGA